MFCPKCGDPIDLNENYCSKCGNYLGDIKEKLQIEQPANVQVDTQINIPNNDSNISSNINSNIETKVDVTKNENSNVLKMVFLGAGIGVAILIIIAIIVITSLNDNYYFTADTYDKEESSSNINEKEEPAKKEDTSASKTNKYRTSVIYNNTYSDVTINGEQDAYDLIVKDSEDQKKDNYPSTIKKVEDSIISNYDIAAVNLREMDSEFAAELGNVFKVIYEEYPSVSGYITNLTLVNASLSEQYIAAFMPVFTFATADTPSEYPWVIKTQVLLNSTYFLNQDRLKSSVQDGSSTGHFPPNATIYSPVAHELGHYLSFLAMMKYYDMESILLVDSSNIDKFYDVYSDFAKGDFSLKMITEAYENCKKDTNTTLTLDEWRATISNYAVAKDNSGNYIYDETIAEAFHDKYLNGDNAQEASKYVVEVLKKYLEEV